MERENRELKEKVAELYLEHDHLKNTQGLPTPAETGQYLRDHLTEFGSVDQGIEIMKLAASSYYYKPKGEVEGQARSDAELSLNFAPE